MELVYEYKGVEYKGTVEYSIEDQLYFGQIIDLDGALFLYEGETIDELEQDFQESVKMYHDVYRGLLDMLTNMGTKLYCIDDMDNMKQIKDPVAVNQLSTDAWAFSQLQQDLGEIKQVKSDEDVVSLAEELRKKRKK